MPENLDPVTFSIISQALAAVPREMAGGLRRSAFSSVVREARDFCVAITDAQGEVVSQPPDTIPMMTLGISEVFTALRQQLDLGEIGSDCAILFNDPFNGGQHLEDVFLLSPVYWESRLVGFSCSAAHHVDIGGSYPGLSPHATELYQEGIRLPPVPFRVATDWNGGFIEQLIRQNVRVPDVVVGDLDAQFAANYIGVERLRQLCDRYSSVMILRTMEQIKDYSEARLRGAIMAIPDGTYVNTQVLDGQPWGDNDCDIIARVTVAGDQMNVDFAGTHPQVLANVNCPLASTHAAVYTAVLGMLGDTDIPFNEGCNRPIAVEVPAGSLLNPRPPAAVRARLTCASRAFDAVVAALGQAVPTRAVATGFDTTTSVSLSWLNDCGEYQVVIEVLGGGWGASRYADGADGLDNPISNCANAPVEALESAHDYFRVVEYSLVPDSGGRGMRRGGLGFRRVYEVLRDGVQVACYSDRHRYPAAGIAGGEAGGKGSLVLLRADGESRVLEPLCQEVLNRGDRLEVVTGGGGGFGRPAARDPEDEQCDLKEGLATLANRSGFSDR